MKYVIRGTVHRGNVRLKKLSIRGIVRSENCSSGNCPSGNCPSEKCPSGNYLDTESNKACKIDEYLDTKNCLCKKCLVCKLVLPCKNEVLNTPKTLLDDKKNVRCEKNNFFLTLVHW